MKRFMKVLIGRLVFVSLLDSYVEEYTEIVISDCVDNFGGMDERRRAFNFDAARVRTICT